MKKSPYFKIWGFFMTFIYKRLNLILDYMPRRKPKQNKKEIEAISTLKTKTDIVQKPDKEIVDKSFLKELALWKTKIAYTIGSLETVNFLLKNEDPELAIKNMDHIRLTVKRILSDLKKDL